MSDPYDMFLDVMSEETKHDIQLKRDVEKILQLPENAFREAWEGEGQQQLPRQRLNSVSSSGCSSEVLNCDSESGWERPMRNDYTKCDWMVGDNNQQDIGNPRCTFLGSLDKPIYPNHMQYGVLNIHINERHFKENFKNIKTVIIGHQNSVKLESISSGVSDKRQSEQEETSVIHFEEKEEGFRYLKETDAKLILTKLEEEDKGSCTVCTKPALIHSSYGGQVCSSCRSFFRRSVQSSKHLIYTCRQNKRCKIDPGTRKNCQHCRFKTCLESGMKITWVLSDEERNRRFNKSNMSSVRPSVLCLAFSADEQHILQDVRFKFQVPWLQNLLIFDGAAGITLLEYAYGQHEFKIESWEKFKTSMSLNFLRFILPTFSELDDLSPHDVGQIMSGPNSGIAQFFRLSYWINIGTASKRIICPVTSELKILSEDHNMVKVLELEDLLSRLDLSKDASDTRRPSYDELYPVRWAGDRQAEERHREAVFKIVDWPADDKNKFDYLMAMLMTMILVFNADFYTLVNKEKVEKIQLKYIMILQRYLRSKLSPKSANTKFLEGMMLIAHAQEAWEISSTFKYES